tara:strand:+ start:567 stop:1043 length:477 start_codon:yes stop_codon:yes gene_type:complete
MVLLSHSMVTVFMIFMTSCGSANHKSIVDTAKYSHPVEQNTNSKVDSVIISLIEQSINSEKLLPYYHFELSERLPIWILLEADKSVLNKKVKCFDYQAELIGTKKAEGSVIEIVEINRSESIIEMIFKYELEGIVFTSSFEKEKTSWRMKSFNLVEQK